MPPGRLGRARRQFGVMLGLFARMALFGPRLDFRARCSDLAQTLLASPQFVGNRQVVRKVRRVRRLGFRQQIGDFGLQLRLDLASMLMRQRAVAAGVGVDFRAVEADRSHLQHAHLTRQQQNLNEQCFDLFEKPPPERRDCIVVGMIVGRDETERHRVVRRPLQLPAREYARRITVNQHPQQHSGMVRRRPSAPIRADHRAQIEPVDHLDHKTRQMPLRQPLVHRRRQQKTRLPIDRAEVAHR